jgi:hypothetical protein
MLGFVDSMPDCWLEVSLHPKGPCDRPARSGFSVVFLGPRANVELVPKFHVALHAFHAALPMVVLQISPCTNLTLTFGLDLLTLFMGDIGEGALHRENEVAVRQRN